MRVGVLAIQGGFAEHISHLKKAGAALAEKEVRQSPWESQHNDGLFLETKRIVLPEDFCSCWIWSRSRRAKTFGSFFVSFLTPRLLLLLFLVFVLDDDDDGDSSAISEA